MKKLSITEAEFEKKRCLWKKCYFLREIPRNETHWGCYFIVVIFTEMKFYFGW